MSTDMTTDLLDEANKSILSCPYCLGKVKGRLVPGEGNKYAKIIIIGEAPGKKEDETGRPFVGRSGRLLDKTLESAGMDRKDLYITSILKYYPGKRPIRQDEIAHGKIHLLEQLSSFDVRLLVLLGNTALRALSGSKVISITKARGAIIKTDRFTALPVFHPAAILRTPSLYPFFAADFECVSRIYLKLKSDPSYKPATGS